ncbi:uncharacterized protein LOC112457073, partial [Temnothorax curvispinosus]|uniref:Uncharacterized protein LOC112457073 n=1 Tax=Temnothorax curvispinosus TaxID=300111 RepID=A0A6J1Q0Q9_9HYME
MPEESFDLQAPDSLDDTLGYQETIDSNLLDTHTAAPIIDESEPDSEPLLMDNIRTNKDSPQRSRGRLRLCRRGCNLQRAAPIINESEPDSESLLMGNIRTNENSPQRSRGRLRLRRRGCNLQR